MAPTPYTINVDPAAISKLKERLELSEFPDELDTEEQWCYGAPLSDVKRLARYWQDGFDWKKQEEELNKLPNFRTNISVDGFGDIDIHFVHQVNENKNAIPLLFCHGWPGSFIEVTKLLPLLTGTSTSPAFHVVAPSLPNFGFSQRIRKPGFALSQYAETCHKLMQSLGYTTYVTQGGDWGFWITRTMGLLYPASCLASHINMLPASAPSLTTNPLLALQHALTPYTAREERGLSRRSWFLEEGQAYRRQQATKPQTLSYALSDSPIALLSWIYEKLHDWTDAYPWTDDEILTWVSIYRFSTAGPNAHVRIYYEAAHNPTEAIPTRERMCQWIPRVKLGVAHFPMEITPVPISWARTLGPVVYESVSEKGGHFAAWECPEIVGRDLGVMFGRGGACFGIVEGRSGF